jgi:ApbE superfamily uncharacterized protein (UPF0280 family)
MERVRPDRERPGRGTALRARLADGRWHFQHGPIDLLIGADGDRRAVARAVEGAWVRFATILKELVCELALLRGPVQDAGAVHGAVAQRMVAACWPYRAEFITPMAAVAGAVADEVIECFGAQAGVRRAYVNNGGDIALRLQPGERYRVGLFADLARVAAGARLALDGEFTVHASMPVRGVATSGWRGRSFSLGIADAVTVLARCAAEADAAATMIANAVNVDDECIVRRPARALKDDSDLGDRLVTAEVGNLSAVSVDRALAAGEARARALVGRGLIRAAWLALQGRRRAVVGDDARRPVADERSRDRAALSEGDGESEDP